MDTKISIRPNEPLYKQAAPAGMFQLMFPYYTMSFPMQKYVPTRYSEVWSMYRNGYFEVAYYEKGLEAVVAGVLETCKEGLPETWAARWAELKVLMLDTSRKLVGADMEALSLEELQALYDELFALDNDMWAISIFIDAFDCGLDRKEMERIAAQHGLSEEEIGTLVTPIEPSFVTAWELALKEYADGRLSKEELIHRFYWFGVNYTTVEEVTDAFIERELKSLHPVELPDIASEEREILARHGLSGNPLSLFRTFSVWRDDRKYLNYVGLYGLVKIQREILRRYGVDPKYTNVVLPHQIQDLIDGALAPEEVARRYTEGLFMHLKPDGEFEYRYGTEAQGNWQVVLDALHALHAGEEATEIKGTIASKGKMQGTVRVLMDFNDPKASEFSAGDILVTSMTRPEFLPLMKLAGAIVTDEGGITSHAAIVSRELKKPCIIGTRTATQAFKDGDLLEVDADAGIIRKL